MRVISSSGRNSVNGEALSPRCLRVLTAIAWLQSKRKTLTIRNIMGVLGKTSTNAVQPVLHLLKKQGLVDFEVSVGKNCAGRKNATLQPTCRFILADDLGKERA